jgi:hypothetical protein
MAPDDSSGARPAPVVLRIKLRYDDVESMVQRFAPNVGKSGLFLPTKSLQPVGAELKFELRIADDTPVLVGLGRVKAAKPPDPAAPRAAFGMAIELMRVTRESRDVILRMLARRKELGLPEIGIPMPADIDAARRAEVVETQVKDTASAAVPAPVPPTESGPSEGLLTSPRRQSGPIAIARLNVVEALAPEAPRRKRPAIHEVIESASGPIVSVVSVPGLDEDIDVGAVLARARALAGGDLDAELDALREVAAAPLEVSIEAASAELARQLGGKAVSKKDRSARWAPPPEVAAPVVAKQPALIVQSDPAIEVPREPEPVAEVVLASPDTAVESPAPQPTFPAAPTFVDDEDSAPVHAAPMTTAELRTDPANVPLIHDDVDPAAFEERESSANEVEPDQIADEIHQLEEDDFEEVEHTQIGAGPEVDAEAEADPDPSFQQHAFHTEPAVAEALERSLDAQLADAEAEADEDDMGISGAYQLPQEQPPVQLAAAPLHLDDVPEEAAPEDGDEELEEIDEFEILAEADEQDADLLASHGEADASGDHELEIPRARAPREPEPEPRPSISDFVSRLDLSDEFEAAPEPEPDNARPFSGRHASFSELDHRLDQSAGHALAGFEEPEQRSAFDEPASYDERPSANLDDLDADSNYTVAERSPPPADIFDAPHTGFAGHAAYDPDAPPQTPYSAISARKRSFDQSDVDDSGVPHTLRGPKPTAPPGPQPGDDGYDLETALEALDVDLDDLSVPHERPATKPPRPNTKIPKRATTSDGVLIEFDDEEGDPIPE